jgi:4-amino-4-deoxy-L-arabinose transferase-like glycosyltransferase
MAYLMALEAFGFGAAVVAGLATALGPFTLVTTALFYSETLFTFLFTASLWSWSRKRGILAGLLLGAATLTRSVCFPLIGIALLLALFAKTNRSLHLKLALAALVIVAPWTLRNAVTQHAFIPVANIGWGANMLIGTIDVPYGSGNEWITLSQDRGFMDIIESAPTADEAEKRMSALASERIRAAPLHWLWIRLKQYPRFWLGTGDFISMQPVVKYGYILGACAFWGLAGAGLFLARRRWRDLYPLALFPILLAGAHFLGSAEERYSLGLVPAAAVFAGSALIQMLRSRRL